MARSEMTVTVEFSREDRRRFDKIISLLTPKQGVKFEESGLVAHARRELELIGEEDETVQGYLRVIQAFADMGHSGGSAAVAVPVINELLQFHNLSPLTDNADEWIEHSSEKWDGVNGVWQSVRRSEAFSEDGGKTYELLPEIEIAKREGKDIPRHTSKPHKKD